MLIAGVLLAGAALTVSAAARNRRGFVTFMIENGGVVGENWEAKLEKVTMPGDYKKNGKWGYKRCKVAASFTFTRWEFRGRQKLY